MHFRSRDRVDDDDVDRARAHQHVGDFEGLLAGVRLRDEQVVDVDAEFFGIHRVEGVLGIDERGGAAVALDFGDHFERQGGFTGGFGAVDFDHAAARQTADAERDVEAERAGRDRFDVVGGDGVAEAAVVCAERLLAAGQAGEAAKLYDAVRTGTVSEQRQAEATRGLILARGTEGIPLLIETLRSPTRRMMNIGLFTGRELLDGPEAGAVDVALIDEITRMAGSDAGRAALLINVVADRNADGGAPAGFQAKVLRFAASGPQSMRLAALEAYLTNSDPAAASALAGRAGVPVRPAVIVGSDQLYVGRNWIRRPRVLVAVGEPILPPGKEEKRAGWVKKLGQKMREVYEEARHRHRLHPHELPHTPQERWKAGR